MRRFLVLAGAGLVALAVSAAGQDVANPTFAARARLEQTAHAKGIFSAAMPKACIHAIDPDVHSAIVGVCSPELDGRRFKDIPRDDRIIVAAEVLRRSTLRGLAPREAAHAMIGQSGPGFAASEAEIDCLVNLVPGEKAGEITVASQSYAPDADPPAFRARFSCGLARNDGPGELIISTAWLFFDDGVIARLQGLSSRANLPAMLALHDAMLASFRLGDASKLK